MASYGDMQAKPVRDMQGIDQCLDRLGELRGLANQIRQTLETMDTKLLGSKLTQTGQSSSPAPQPIQSNVEEMNQKIQDLHQLLNMIHELAFSLNKFINAEIH